MGIVDKCHLMVCLTKQADRAQYFGIAKDDSYSELMRSNYCPPQTIHPEFLILLCLEMVMGANSDEG